MSNWILVALAVVTASLRVYGVNGIFFQANAHLLMGGLIVGWYLTRKPLPGLLAIGLSAVEVACFFLLK